MKPYRLVLRAVIKNERGEYLLMKRSSKCKSFPGFWEFPGGKAESGENLNDALIREIREETGYMVALLKVIGCSDYEMDEYRSAYLFFQAQITDGQFVMSDEHEDFAWMDGKRLKEARVPPQLKGLVASLV